MFQSYESHASSAESAARLATLRAALTGAGAAAFIIPRRDTHNGETVAPADERLAWLTGFSGSAGTAAVTATEAALFVDGRYTLQAAREADNAVVEVLSTPANKPETWLGERLGEGEAFAYDPWLHPPAEVERLTKAIGRPAIAMMPSPIDSAWTDRPPRPAGAVIVHPAAQAGEPAGDKRARIAETLVEGGAAATVLTLPDSIAWL
ncbi:MAG: aminopeptidase P family N-terminal domain-containing protein, partial [Pseudomonadota bacterium]